MKKLLFFFLMGLSILVVSCSKPLSNSEELVINNVDLEVISEIITYVDKNNDKLTVNFQIRNTGETTANSLFCELSAVTSNITLETITGNLSISPQDLPPGGVSVVMGTFEDMKTPKDYQSLEIKFSWAEKYSDTILFKGISVDY